MSLLPRRLLAAIACCCLLPLAWGDDDVDTLAGTAGEPNAELARQAQLEIAEGGDAQERCIALHQRGIARVRLGQYGDGIADLKLALSLNQPNRLAPNQWCERWRLQNDLSHAYWDSGDRFAQIELLVAAGQELRETHIRRYMHSQRMQVDPYVSLGMLKEAEDAYRRAGEVLPAVRQRRDWGVEGPNVMDSHLRTGAYLQELRGNYVEAERMRREALLHAEQYVINIARTERKEHQLQRVAALNVPNAMRQLASNLATQGKLGEAEFFAREALARLLRYHAFNTRSVASALAELGFIKLQQGRLDAAERWYRKTLQAMEGADLKPYSTAIANARAKLAFVLAAQGRWNEADALFSSRDTGLRSNAQQFARHGSNHIDWALTRMHAGDADGAAAMLRRMIDGNSRKEFVDPLFIAQLRGYQGVALTAAGKHETALAAFREALPVLLRQAGEDAGNENNGFFRLYRLRVVLEGYLDLLGTAYERRLQLAGLDPATEAFRIADIARGSSVQRALTASVARATLPAGPLADLARKEQDTANRIQSLGKLMERLLSAPEGQRLQKVIGDMRRDLETLQREHAAQRRDLAQRFPDYANLIDPRPATPADIQSALQGDEAVLAFYTAESRTYVWTLNRQQTGFRVLPYGRADATRDAATLRQAFDLTEGRLKDFDTALAHRIYQSLLEPDAGMWRGARVLNVIPHGPLAQVPFAVLLTAPAGSGDTPWLLRQVALAQQPSANGLLALRRAVAARGDRLPFVGFGDPLFSLAKAEGGNQVRNLKLARANDTTADLVQQAQQGTSAVPAANVPTPGLPTLAQAFSLLTPLPDTAQELEEIAQSTHANPARDLYIGRRASEANVKRADLARYRVLAFATHGLTPGELRGLDQPALALSNPALVDDPDNDGLLTLDEVLGLKLNADWVVLSACNTASADGAGGEAISGLGRGFFYAGARSLLVSNWAVETVSARLLTTGLFRQQAATPQMSRAEALRQSMLTVMGEPSGRYAHPAFWAPFSLVGDGTR